MLKFVLFPLFSNTIDAFCGGRQANCRWPEGRVWDADMLRKLCPIGACDVWPSKRSSVVVDENGHLRLQGCMISWRETKEKTNHRAGESK